MNEKNIFEDTKCYGIYWLKEEFEGYDKINYYNWWGICKKTRKVAHVGVITNSLEIIKPLIVQDSYVIESENYCQDGKYCLNIECPYCTSKNLLESIYAQCSAMKQLDEKKVIGFFKRVITFINDEYVLGLLEKEFNEIFIDEIESTHINENAFVTTFK